MYTEIRVVMAWETASMAEDILDRDIFGVFWISEHEVLWNDF